MKTCKGIKIIGVICKSGACGHSNRLEAYSIDLVWEFDSAPHESRKNLSCHPLNRNRFQIQKVQGVEERKGGIRWIIWEVEVPGSKYLESVKVWEDTRRALHPFGQPDRERRERAEEVEAVWSHKVGYSISVIKLHKPEVWCGSCGDCSHEWFKEAAKITALVQLEELKVFQRWHNLKCLTFSGPWK